jgi:hypothetical protein
MVQDLCVCLALLISRGMVKDPISTEVEQVSRLMLTLAVWKPLQVVLHFGRGGTDPQDGRGWLQHLRSWVVQGLLKAQSL